MSHKTDKNINLLADFPPHTIEAWQEAADKLLKGKPRESLLTKTYENITLNPIYSKDDSEQSRLKETLPGEPPYTRGYNPDNSGKAPWHILNEIRVSDTVEFNRRLQQNLNSGQNAIFLRMAQGSPFVKNMDHWRSALNNINLENNPIFVKSDFPAAMGLDFIKQLFKEYYRDLKKLHGGLFYDPLARASSHGKTNFNHQNYYRNFTELYKEVHEQIPNFCVFNNDATAYHNAGANAVQELAFVMAAAVESIRQMQNRNNDLDFSTHFRLVDFNFSIGSNFFMEIAKLRAARILWHSISKAFDKNGEPKIRIHAETGLWNKTILDEHTNILRTTTEGFSAILGGCDSLLIYPFNSLSDTCDNFSERIARNIQLILRDEAHANKVIDTAGGSWYIESLTTSLAQKSWDLFREVEQRGGMLMTLKSGFVQQIISETYKRRTKDIETRRRKIIGANIYPTLRERKFEANGQSPRAAEPFEKLRALMEACASENSRPEVLLLNYGSIEQYKPRADFARGFFEVAGFDVKEMLLDASLEIAIDSNPKIIIFCSGDALYPDFVPQAAQKIKKQNKSLKIVVAGNPAEHIETLRRAGVDDFIHIKSNVFQTLNSLMEELGIA